MSEQELKVSYFLKFLADMLSRKDGAPLALVMVWLRTCLSFEILRSVHVCFIRGPRVRFHNESAFLNDFPPNAIVAAVL